MTHPLRLALAALICLAAGAGMAEAQSYASEPQAPLFDSAGIDQNLGAQVPLDLTFFDETGREVTLRELIDGKPVVLNLVYYECPMLCNLTMDGLVRGLKTLSLDAGKDFTVITVSFDPRETPALAAAAKRTAMQRYGRPGAAEGWHFLTGREAPIRKLADTVGFRYAYDPERDEFAHAAGAMVLSPDGVVSRYFFGIQFPPRDMRLAIVEASEGKVGSLVDRVLLLCYHYDPATGRYGWAVVAALRLLGMLTLTAMGGGIAVMLYRERKSAAAKSRPGAASSESEPSA